MPKWVCSEMNHSRFQRIIIHFGRHVLGDCQFLARLNLALGKPHVQQVNLSQQLNLGHLILATSVSSMQEQQHSLPMKQQYATITSAHMIFQLTTPCLYIRLYMCYVCICGHMLACQAATNMLTSTLVRARCWGLFWIIKYCGIRTSSLKFFLSGGRIDRPHPKNKYITNVNIH